MKIFLVLAVTILFCQTAFAYDLDDLIYNRPDDKYIHQTEDLKDRIEDIKHFHESVLWFGGILVAVAGIMIPLIVLFLSKRDIDSAREELRYFMNTSERKIEDRLNQQAENRPTKAIDIKKLNEGFEDKPLLNYDKEFALKALERSDNLILEMHENLIFWAAFEAFNKKQFTKSITLYEYFIIKSPNNPNGYNNLGRSYIAIGDNFTALEYFDKALTIDPQNIMARSNKVLAYLYLGRDEIDLKLKDTWFNAALSILKDLEKELPQDVGVLNYLGVLSENLGNFSEALRYHKMAYELKPDLLHKYNYLGGLLLNDRVEETREIINFDEKNSPSVFSALYLGHLAFIDRKDIELVIEYYKTAIKRTLDPIEKANLIDERLKSILTIARNKFPNRSEDLKKLEEWINSISLTS